jgi:hypothetical protein
MLKFFWFLIHHRFRFVFSGSRAETFLILSALVPPDHPTPQVCPLRSDYFCCQTPRPFPAGLVLALNDIVIQVNLFRSIISVDAVDTLIFDM